MKKKIMLLITIMVIGIGMLSGCIDNNNNENNEIPKNPNIQVTSKIWRDGYEGIDYVIWIDVVVYNYGYSGSQTVFCQINQGNNQYLRAERVYLNSHESTSLTFRFPEFSWWSSDSGSYRVWVE